MILDEIKNFSKYSEAQVWKEILDWLTNLHGKTPSGKIVLREGDVFAQVSEYQTKDPAGALPEAHKTFTDIQIVLSGRERLEWTSLDDRLVVSVPHDDTKDIARFERDPDSATSMVLTPGRFAVFYPWDVHTPGLFFAGVPEPVTKMVIKIRTDLLF